MITWFALGVFFAAMLLYFESRVIPLLERLDPSIGDEHDDATIDS